MGGEEAVGSVFGGDAVLHVGGWHLVGDKRLCNQALSKWGRQDRGAGRFIHSRSQHVLGGPPGQALCWVLGRHHEEVQDSLDDGDVR